MIYGLAIICVILLAPEGLFWKVRDFLRKRSAPPAAAPPGAPDAPVAPTSPPHSCRRARQATAGTGDVVLEVRNLSRSFGGLKAVQDVSFKLRRNEILGIIGPNGAGKTTLFNLLNGFLRPDTGEILLDGREMSGRKPHELCEAGIGRTFQIMRPFLRMSMLGQCRGRRLCRAPRPTPRRGSWRPMRSPASACPTIADRIAGELTTKELRLMELARALAGQPRILLLDETLAGLGHDEADEVVAVIQRLARDGMTIVDHRAHDAGDGAPGRPLPGARPRRRASSRASRKPSPATRRVIEAYLGKKWMAHAHALKALDVGLLGHPRPERRLDQGRGRASSSPIVGPNGAGKTTLFKTISGIVTPERGHDHVRRPRPAVDAGRRSARISASPMCPEGRQVFPSLTRDGKPRNGRL